MCNSVSTEIARKNLSLDNIRNFCPPKEKTSLKSYVKRRRAKAITVAKAKRLCALDNERLKGYMRAHECAKYLFQDGNKVIAHYCKHRCCNVCNRIKAARMLNAYSKPLLELKNMYFVTLTTPNVIGQNLRNEIELMGKVWRRIYKSIKKSRPDLVLKGMRKLECTYNHKAKTYNPHYHFLLESKETAQYILDRWLMYFSDANIKGQDVRKADKNSLLEIFKYVSKSVVGGTYSANADDTIYASLKGVNTYYPIGLKKYVSEEIEELQSQIITHKSERVDVWKWCNDSSDWYTSENEAFIDKDLAKKTKRILSIIEDSKQSNKEPKTKENVLCNLREEIRNKEKIIDF